LQDAPAGLAGALGLGGAATAAKQTLGDTERRVSYAAEPVRKSSSLWKWLLLLALFGGLLWLLSTLLSKPKVPEVAVTTPSLPSVPAPSVPSVSLPRVDLGAFLDKRLPNGVSLRIPTNGVENRLLGFIEDTNQSVSKETWFSFDRLEFETGSDKLKASSQEQLRNISEILKAYPSVNVKIGGYTDNVGNPAANLKLSTDRASTTLTELANLGIDRARLASEGYGEQYPVADNATEEGRQRNRRIDIRVTKK
jgi:outer membrane protein OmpA-like peptidoglycan-associated protein